MNTTATAPAPADPAAGLELVLPGRGVSFGAAVSWVTRSWKIFMQAPLMWIVALLIMFLANVVLSFVPLIGTIAINLLQPVYLAGFAAACRSLETGGEFEIEQLFAGFRTRSTDLIIVGLVMILGMIVIFAIFMGFVGWAIVAAMFTGDVHEIERMIEGAALQIVLGMLVCALFVVPLLAAYWFAPFLVYMHGMKPLDAMKASFMACVKNFFQMFVYGVVVLVIAGLATLVAVIPFIGWLFTLAVYFVLGIMAFTAIYPAYRDIFTEEASPPAARVTL